MVRGRTPAPAGDQCKTAAGAEVSRRYRVRARKQPKRAADLSKKAAAFAVASLAALNRPSCHSLSSSPITSSEAVSRPMLGFFPQYWPIFSMSATNSSVSKILFSASDAW